MAVAGVSMLRSADLQASTQNLYTVDNSPQTPPSINSSPTNVHSHLHVRQLRPQKQALYTPACLRPTEPLSRPKNIPDRPRALDTPPDSQDSSFESGSALIASGGVITGSFSQGSPRRGAPDAGQEDLGYALETAFLDDAEVSGPPTAAHWKPDASASSCTICKTSFTWYFRRHHCRRCGDLVCASHFLRTVPLDQNARLHRRGMKSKACDTCFKDWQNLKALHSRTSSVAESQSSLRPPVPIPQHLKPGHGHRVGSMAKSEGMVWSTF